jgi:nitrogen regulatory protein PII 1
MVMIRGIIRRERADCVLSALLDAGFPAATRIDVFGRGRQRGIRAGEVIYDELPKEMLLLVVEDDDRDEVIDIILSTARTGEHGAFGDGKIFVSPVEEVWTVRTGQAGL